MGVSAIHILFAVTINRILMKISRTQSILLSPSRMYKK